MLIGAFYLHSEERDRVTGNTLFVYSTHTVPNLCCTLTCQNTDSSGRGRGTDQSKKVAAPRLTSLKAEDTSISSIQRHFPYVRPSAFHCSHSFLNLAHVIVTKDSIVRICFLKTVGRSKVPTERTRLQCRSVRRLGSA